MREQIKRCQYCKNYVPRTHNLLALSDFGECNLIERTSIIPNMQTNRVYFYLTKVTKTVPYALVGKDFICLHWETNSGGKNSNGKEECKTTDPGVVTKTSGNEDCLS